MTRPDLSLHITVDTVWRVHGRKTRLERERMHALIHSTNIFKYQLVPGARPVAGVTVGCGIHASPGSHRASLLAHM